MSLCNLCSYEQIQRLYGKRNVRTVPSPLGSWSKGVKVQIRVKDAAGKAGPWKDYDVWYTEPPIHCSC